MELAQAKVEAATGGSGSGRSGQAGADPQPGSPGAPPQLLGCLNSLKDVQALLQRHGGRLLAGGDAATAMQLVAMLRGMAAANLQLVRLGHNPVVHAPLLLALGSPIYIYTYVCAWVCV